MFKFLGPFEKYVRSDGGKIGYSKNMRKMYKGRGVLQKYT